MLKKIIFKMTNIIRNNEKVDPLEATYIIIDYLNYKINNQNKKIYGFINIKQKTLDSLEECYLLNEKQFNNLSNKYKIIQIIVDKILKGKFMNRRDDTFNNYIYKYLFTKDNIKGNVISISNKLIDFTILNSNEKQIKFHKIIDEYYTKKGEENHLNKYILPNEFLDSPVDISNIKKLDDIDNISLVSIEYNFFNDESKFNDTLKMISKKINKDGIIVILDCDLEKKLKNLKEIFYSNDLYIDSYINTQLLDYNNKSFTILKKGKAKDNIKYMSIDNFKTIEEKEIFTNNYSLKIKESLNKYYIDIELFLANKEKDFKIHSLRNYLDIYNSDKSNLNEILIERKDFLEVEDLKSYKLISIHNNFKGCSIRDNLNGNKIKTKKQRKVKENDICFSKINTFNGYICKITKELDNSIISNSYSTFSCNINKVLPEYLILKLNDRKIIKKLKLSSNRDVSGRYYLKIKEFLKTTFIKLPSIEEQQKVIKKIKEIDDTILELKDNQNKLFEEIVNY